jgi:L-lactate dehydrogenase complex protein LldE
MSAQTVQLMVTCLVDRMAPEVGKATVRVLRRAGCRVEVPEGLTCCGQPAFNVGLVGEARSMAARTVQILAATDGPIVIPSGSCASMVTVHYPGLLADTGHQTAADGVASRTRELSQYLVDDLGAIGFDSVCEGCTVAVHRSCHGLRNLGLGEKVEQLMAPIAGATVVELEGAEECCGFGGLFSIEMPDVSAAILDTKLDMIERSGAGTLVAGDVSCLLHIEGGLRRRKSTVSVRHFVELLGGDHAT